MLIFCELIWWLTASVEGAAVTPLSKAISRVNWYLRSIPTIGHKAQNSPRGHMERYALTFLAGAATTTLAVIATGAYTLTFFSLGFVSAIIIALLVCRLIGAARLAQLLTRNAKSGQANASRSERPATGRRPRPVTDETLYARYRRMPKREKMRVELEAWNEAFEHGLAEPATASAEAVELFSQAPAEAPATAAQDTVAADVESALKNLKVPAKVATAAVRQASQGAQLDFEPLFRSALNIAEGKAA